MPSDGGRTIAAVIDLHSHVLAGIDDGPEDYEGSLALVRAAAADGTHTLAATPHLRHDFPTVQLREIASRCVSLNHRLPADLQVTVVPGGEVDLIWAQEASVEELRLASYWQRGSDLLVETPYGPLATGFEELLFRISLQGFRILLAHPERNPTFQGDPPRLAALVDRGVLVQVTASSLASTDRQSRSRRLALLLIEEAIAHVIASDAHSAGSMRAPLSAGVAAAARRSPARAEWMVRDAPAAILAGEPLPAPPQERSTPRRGLLRRARRAG